MNKREKKLIYVATEDYETIPPAGDGQLGPTPTGPDANWIHDQVMKAVSYTGKIIKTSD